MPGESEAQSNLAQFWLHKRTIARSVAAKVMAFFKPSAGDEISLVAACEKFRQTLLSHMSNTFIFSCATVFKVSDVSIGSAENAEILPECFYGKFQKHEAPPEEISGIEKSVETPDQSYLITSGKIEYFQSEGGQNGGWRLPVICRMKML